MPSSLYAPTTTSASSSRTSTATTNTANTTPWQSPEPTALRTPKRHSSSSTTTTLQKANTWSNSPSRQARTSLDDTGAWRERPLSKHTTDAGVPIRRSQQASSSARPKRDSAGKDQWWESVVPPGQLAERLRRAQEASATCLPSLSSTSAKHLGDAASDDMATRSARKNTTRSNVKLGSVMTTSRPDSVASVSQSSSMDVAYLCPPGSSLRTSSSISSSLASHVPSSTRSSISIGDASSAASSDESSSERRSPLFDEWAVYGARERSSGTTSPTGVTRSQSSRRCRIVGSGSEEGVGLGVSIRGAKGSNAVDLDERLRQWNSGLPFHPSANHSGTLGLRPFPSSSRSTASAAHHSSDLSSEEDDRRRSTRTSSIRSTNTLREAPRTIKSSLSRASAPPSRRSSLSNHSASQAPPHHHRHVSFNKDVEFVEADDIKGSQTIGRAHGRTMSAVHSARMTAEPVRQAQRFPSHANRLPAHQTADVKAHAHSHVRGKRMPCHSAPTSPRLTSLPALKEHTTVRTSFDATRKEGIDQSVDNAHPEAHLALLSSLAGGHTHLASARSLAATLTRHFSAPLRPILHMTLLASMSGMAFMALAGFLLAGYLCTVWDDVNSRGKSLHRNVNSARSRIESRVHWTRTALGIAPGEAASTTAAEKASTSTTRHHRRTSSQSSYKMLTAPLRFAIAIPAAFAHSVTPEAVRTAFAAEPSEVTSAGRRAAARPSPPSSSTGKHSMPPRPPLSALLPSIAFTIMIAFGAGLASFFANRAAADSTSSSGTSSGARTATNSATSSPPLQSNRAHLSGRFDGAQVRRHSHHPALNSDDLSASLRQLNGRRSPYLWQDVPTSSGF